MTDEKSPAIILDFGRLKISTQARRPRMERPSPTAAGLPGARDGVVVGSAPRRRRHPSSTDSLEEDDDDDDDFYTPPSSADEAEDPEDPEEPGETAGSAHSPLRLSNVFGPPPETGSALPRTPERPDVATALETEALTDYFYVELADAQVLAGSLGEDWRGSLLLKETPMHIVEKFTVCSDIHRWRGAPTTEHTGLALKGRLPHFRVSPCPLASAPSQCSWPRVACKVRPARSGPCVSWVPCSCA